MYFVLIFRLWVYFQIEEVVARLTRPTIASQGVMGTSEREMVKSQATNHPKYLGLKEVTIISLLFVGGLFKLIFFFFFCKLKVKQPC